MKHEKSVFVIYLNAAKEAEIVFISEIMYISSYLFH
jgi:hypothetical protein